MGVRSRVYDGSLNVFEKCSGRQFGAVWWSVLPETVSGSGNGIILELRITCSAILRCQVLGHRTYIIEFLRAFEADQDLYHSFSNQKQFYELIYTLLSSIHYFCLLKTHICRVLRDSDGGVDK